MRELVIYFNQENNGFYFYKTLCFWFLLFIPEIFLVLPFLVLVTDQKAFILSSFWFFSNCFFLRDLWCKIEGLLDFRRRLGLSAAEISAGEKIWTIINIIIQALAVAAVLVSNAASSNGANVGFIVWINWACLLD